MKRIISIIILAAAVLCLISAAGTPGSSSDPLVTKSYVDDVFVPETVSKAEASAVSVLGAESERALRRAEALRDSAMMRLGVPGYTLSDSFVPVALESGGTVSMLTGGKFVPTSGSFSVSVNGTLINITTGSEVPSGSQLTLNNRYFCAEDTTVTYTARSASSCLVDGYYKTSGSSGVTPSDGFTDIKPGQYYYDPVLWAVNHEPQITNGTSSTTFSPADPCTRGQTVTFLWRANGCPEPDSTYNPFKDVPAGAYYYKAVLWAVENNITNGTSSDTFSPNAPCTRAHVVTFLWRSADRPASGSSNPFDDVPYGQYYTDAVLWAVTNRITNGTSTDTFSPDDPCTRGQIVTFLYRYMN